MRLGRFKITAEFYRNNELMIAIQRDMAVLNVRIDYETINSYEFMAVGKMFDDIAEYSLVPEYDCVVTKHTDDTLTFTFKRIS